MISSIGVFNKPYGLHKQIIMVTARSNTVFLHKRVAWLFAELFSGQRFIV